MNALEAARLRHILAGAPTVQVPESMWNNMLKVYELLEDACNSEREREKNAA